MIVSLKYLRDNRDHIFVFGDNTIRKGKKGGARFRDEPNSYGFITKKYPSYNNDAYYKPSQYNEVYKNEIKKLKEQIELLPDFDFLISKIGGGLANKYRIFDKVIEPNIKNDLGHYHNVKFLF